MELSMLPDDCLRSVFLHLPIRDRIRFRAVCRRWREISDDCWRETKSLSVFRDGEWYPTVIRGDYRRIVILPATPKFYNEIAKRCAPYITTLMDESRGMYSVSLPEIDVTYDRLRTLHVSVCSRPEDLRVSKLLSQHRKIESLNIAFGGNRKCIEKLCTSYLTEFTIFMKNVSDRVNSEFLISKIEEKLRCCKSLKKFQIFGYFSDEMVRLVSDNIHLRDLAIHGASAARYPLTPVGLHCIAKLTSLTKINLSFNKGGFVTPQLLKILTTHCLDLENVRLCTSTSVSDIDLLLLLRLQKLRSLAIRCMPRVSGKNLYRFSNIETVVLEFTWADDAAIVALLRSAPNLKYLDVVFNSLPTIECLDVAVEEVQKRTNNVPLVFKAEKELIRSYQLCKSVPPLLHLGTEHFLEYCPSHFM